MFINFPVRHLFKWRFPKGPVPVIIHFRLGLSMKSTIQRSIGVPPDHWIIIIPDILERISPYRSSSQLKPVPPWHTMTYLDIPWLMESPRISIDSAHHWIPGYSTDIPGARRYQKYTAIGVSFQGASGGNNMPMSRITQRLGERSCLSIYIYIYIYIL